MDILEVDEDVVERWSEFLGGRHWIRGLVSSATRAVRRFSVSSPGFLFLRPFDELGLEHFLGG